MEIDVDEIDDMSEDEREISKKIAMSDLDDG